MTMVQQSSSCEAFWSRVDASGSTVGVANDGNHISIDCLKTYKIYTSLVRRIFRPLFFNNLASAVRVMAASASYDSHQYEIDIR